MCSNPSKLHLYSTGGRLIHWSTSIQHAISFTRSLFTGLPPFNTQSALHAAYSQVYLHSTRNQLYTQLIHWSTSIQRAISFTRSLFTGLPPFNAQSALHAAYSQVYLHSTRNQLYTQLIHIAARISANPKHKLQGFQLIQKTKSKNENENSCKDRS